MANGPQTVWPGAHGPGVSQASLSYPGGRRGGMKSFIPGSLEFVLTMVHQNDKLTTTSLNWGLLPGVSLARLPCPGLGMGKDIGNAPFLAPQQYFICPQTVFSSRQNDCKLCELCDLGSIVLEWRVVRQWIEGPIPNCLKYISRHPYLYDSSQFWKDHIIE